MNDLIVIEDQLPTLDEINVTPAAQLPALRAKVELALAARPTPEVCGQFYFELIGRIPKCSKEMSDDRVQRVQERLLIQHAAIIPPLVLREVLERAEDEWQWRPTAKEVLDCAIKLVNQHKYLIETIDTRTRQLAAHAERQAEREAGIAEMVKQAKEHFGMADETLRDAWSLAETDLDEKHLVYLRRAIEQAQPWSCNMLAVLGHAKKTLPPASEIDDLQRLLRQYVTFRLRDVFHHLKAGEPIDAKPVEEVYEAIGMFETLRDDPPIERIYEAYVPILGTRERMI